MTIGVQPCQATRVSPTSSQAPGRSPRHRISDVRVERRPGGQSGQRGPQNPTWRDPQMHSDEYLRSDQHMVLGRTTAPEGLILGEKRQRHGDPARPSFRRLQGVRSRRRAQVRSRPARRLVVSGRRSLVQLVSWRRQANCARASSRLRPTMTARGSTLGGAEVDHRQLRRIIGRAVRTLPYRVGAGGAPTVHRRPAPVRHRAGPDRGRSRGHRVGADARPKSAG
jgi:hypothetical protein